jgi:RimJ/RimL family protein N-acetyltransferase
MTLETPRLALRPLVAGDLPALAAILQDAAVMYAWEHPFSDAEVREWFDRQQERYRTDGHGLWAVTRKATGALIGQCGLTVQDVHGAPCLEIGYLFHQAHWHHGYATEAARACKTYAFDALHAPAVYSVIRDTNAPSQRVAERLGMVRVSTVVKQYYGMEMSHDVYEVKNSTTVRGLHGLPQI